MTLIHSPISFKRPGKRITSTQPVSICVVTIFGRLQSRRQGFNQIHCLQFVTRHIEISNKRHLSNTKGRHYLENLPLVMLCEGFEITGNLNLNIYVCVCVIFS